MTWLLGGCLAVLGGKAHAQTLLTDDFESANLLTTQMPPGRWSYLGSSEPTNTLSTAPEAAHWGDGGLLLSDITAGSSSGQVNWLVGDGVPDGQGDIHVRAWVRMTGNNPNQNLNVLMIHGSIAASTLSEFRVDPGATPGLGGYDATSGYSFLNGSKFALGVWMLVEVSALAVGTPAGRRELWVDGVLRLSQANIDWTGKNYTSVLVGTPWGDRSWVGQLSFDDLRVTNEPPATRLSIQLAPGSPRDLPVGRCARLVIGLKDAPGAVATAPYEVEVELSDGIGVGGSFFSSLDCTGAAVRWVTLVSGASVATFGWRPTTLGVHPLLATHPDFLAGTSPVSVVPDPGPGDAGAAQPDGGTQGARLRPLAVGCDCGSTNGVSFPFVLVLAQRLTRRARRVERRSREDDAHCRALHRSGG